MGLRSPATLASAWGLAPALVVAASAAIGWLLARLTDTELGALTVPAGFLAGIALISVLLSVGFSGKLTVALLVALAITGLVVAAREARRYGRIPRVGAAVGWPALAFVIAYTIALAPIVGSGRSGMLGYSMYDDPPIHVAHVEAIANRDASARRPFVDSFSAATEDLGKGYPLGSYAWPVFARVTTGVDAFHVWVPLGAVVLAMIALVAYAMLRALGMPRAFAAAAGVLVGTGHLVYAYHAQGGTKEILVPLTVYGSIALAARAFARPMNRLSLVPAAVGVAAALANLSYAAFAWIGPAALVLVIILRVRTSRGGAPSVLAPLGGALAVSVVLDAPLLVRTAGYLAGDPGVTRAGTLGNLLGPLPFREAFNVWVAHDYRLATPDAVAWSDVGIALAIVLSVVGGLWALGRRDLGISLSLLAGFVAVAAITPFASPYYDAKTYVALAPAIGLATAAGAMALAHRGGVLRVGSLVAAGLLAIGVVVSDAYVYSGVWITPRYRFGELARVARSVRGHGPILVNDSEDLAYYILRGAKPWVEGSFRTPYRSFREPRLPQRELDFDDYTLGHLERFPFLLEQKGPFNSRPPANYAPVQESKSYRLWRRRGPSPRLHLPLGIDGSLGSARLTCRRGVPAGGPARDLFARARALGTSVRAALGPPDPVVALSPPSWVDYRAAPLFIPAGEISAVGGSASTTVGLRPGAYYAWIRGSLGPGVDLYARSVRNQGFTHVGAAADDMSLPHTWHPIGPVSSEGATAFHVVAATRPWYRAASRHMNIIGPIVLTRQGTATRILDVPAGRAASLCGRRLDWLEIPPIGA